MKVYEGAVITCDHDNNTFRYLVEDKGRIIFVGNELPAGYKGLTAERLGERSLIPAFGDTHLHFAAYALFNSGLDVRSARSLPHLCDQVKEFSLAGRDEIIIGFGASASSVEERKLVSKDELDLACPGRPVFISKYDGHTCILNSSLIEKLPRNVKGLRGYDGQTGLMKQEAFFAVTDFITKKVPVPKLLKNMLRAADDMAMKGIGMMHTVSGVGFPMDMDVTAEIIFAKGLNTGFQSRVFFQTMDIGKVKKRKLPRIGGCFATALDGCFGSEDAALNDPYCNDPDNRGILFYKNEQVMEFAKRANREGLQIEMHAIGDAAFDQAVMAIEAALRDCPGKDRRHGIIHSCLPTEEGLQKCAELGIQIPVQPAFLNWDQEPYEYLHAIMCDRADRISPLRRMMDMGIVMSGGSDAPCTLPDPVFGMYAACNHYIPEQSLTIAEALKLFTYNAAWASFDERDRGSLEKGKIADMVILNRNPLSMKPDELLDLKVENLILKGMDYKKGQGALSLLANAFLRGGKS
jgi:predicted amidohydrolase YtcJ